MGFFPLLSPRPRQAEGRRGRAQGAAWSIRFCKKARTEAPREGVKWNRSSPGIKEMAYRVQERKEAFNLIFNLCLRLFCDVGGVWWGEIWS